MAPDDLTPIVYQNRLVAFIDVMGFKELLRLRSESLASLNSYYQTVSEFLEGKSGIYQQTSPSDGFKKLLVSDSVILTIELGDDHKENVVRAARFFSTIGLLQFVLAVRCQIWTRGAVSVGNLFLDEDRSILVGPAFVQAYELESLANYPRVIIDPRVLKFFRLSPKEFVEAINRSGYQGHLLGVNLPVRYDLPPFINDAIQIDWFRHAVQRVSDPLTGFFDDLRKRRSESQELFEKSNKLIRYLLESCLLERETREDLTPQLPNQSQFRSDAIRDELSTMI